METITTPELVEDGAKRDKRGRRLMSAQGVEQLLSEYDQSGLTQAAFARRAGVKYPTFASWMQARRAKSGDNRGEVRFAQIQLPVANASAAELSVTLPDGVIVRGTQAQALAELVRALRGSV